MPGSELHAYRRPLLILGCARPPAPPSAARSRCASPTAGRHEIWSTLPVMVRPDEAAQAVPEGDEGVASRCIVPAGASPVRV